MNDLEALADELARHRIQPGVAHLQCICGARVHSIDAHRADAILARWRLVPVDVADLITQARTEGWYDGDPAWEPIDKALGVQR